MKFITSLIILLCIFVQRPAAQDKIIADSTFEFLQVTTVESVVAGGLGRSRMVVTYPDGTQKESELNNLFSLGGINFKNIKENETTIISTLAALKQKGWKLLHVTPLTLSPADNGGNGIFMTRYLLTRIGGQAP
jgi:hypothetical protein